MVVDEMGIDVIIVGKMVFGMTIVDQMAVTYV
jgi:hypothetical protein